MKDFGLDDAAQERLMERLRAENYLSVERYAAVYTSGKMRNNRWGMSKIKMGLASKGIDKDQAAEAISQVDEVSYLASLCALLERKDELRYNKLPMPERKQKLWRLGVSHGFESGLVSREVKRIIGLGEAEENLGDEG